MKSQNLLILNKNISSVVSAREQMNGQSSVYLSVLDNQWSNFTSHSFNHGVDEQTTCQLARQLPGITELKQKHPQVNVQIKPVCIKPLSKGIYIGEVNGEGKPEGYGMIRYEDRSIVEAQFKDGKANGKGFKWFGQDWYYVGDFLDNTFDGRGDYVSPDICYSGQFKNNVFHGQGELIMTKNKGKFHGLMENGEMKEGKLIWQGPKSGMLSNKFEYNGTFFNNEFHGDNCSLQSNAGVYRGSFREGKKQGSGRFEYKEKYQYVGNYQHNVKSGYGTLYNPQIKTVKGEQFCELSELEKNISYRGQFANNLPHGKGQIYKESENKIVSAEYIEGLWTEALKNVFD